MNENTVDNKIFSCREPINNLNPKILKKRLMTKK